MRSIIGDEYMDPERPEHKRFIIIQANSINSWQQALTDQHKKLSEFMESYKRKPGFPILWSVDSMMGADSDEALGNLKDEGEAAGRGFSDAPILISQFMRGMSTLLLGWPVTLHFSHHEKANLLTHGMRRAGGAAPDFYATLDLQFKKSGGSAYSRTAEINTAKLKGKNITMTVRKSSMGSDVGQSIVVPFLWRFEEKEGGGWRQISWWDWESATADIMYKHKRLLADVLDIECATKERLGTVYWSDALDIKSSKPLKATEFGALVEGDEELRKKVEDALHIEQHQLFQPGVLD
jgi:hypothetical protein